MLLDEAQQDCPTRADRRRHCVHPRTRTAPAHPALAEQQGFADERARILRRAEPSGERLVTALYLVLTRHRPTATESDDGRPHLSCAECRPEGRDPLAQYPCPSAQQAFWALDAALR